MKKIEMGIMAIIDLQMVKRGKYCKKIDGEQLKDEIRKFFRDVKIVEELFDEVEI